jgi:hypothetical protein
MSAILLFRLPGVGIRCSNAFVRKRKYFFEKISKWKMHSQLSANSQLTQTFAASCVYYVF